MTMSLYNIFRRAPKNRVTIRSGRGGGDLILEIDLLFMCGYHDLNVLIRTKKRTREEASPPQAGKNKVFVVKVIIFR